MLTGKMSLTWLPHFNHNNNNNTTELCLVFDSNRWLCKLWWRWLLLLVLYQHNYYQIQTATLIINTFYYKWTLANYDLESVQHCNISSLTCPKAPYFHSLNKSHFPPLALFLHSGCFDSPAELWTDRLGDKVLHIHFKVSPFWRSCSDSMYSS